MHKLTVTLDDNAKTSLANILKHYDPFLSAHAVASAALAVGLEEFAKEPAKLIDLLRANNTARETTPTTPSGAPTT